VSDRSPPVTTAAGCSGHPGSPPVALGQPATASSPRPFKFQAVKGCERGAPTIRRERTPTLRHKKAGKPAVKRLSGFSIRHSVGTTDTEAEGLEPPSGCPRRISSAVPYQLGLRLHSVGTGGFEPPTPRSRSECSTGLSHVPNDRMLSTDGSGGIRTHEGLLTPTRFPIVLLKPLGHRSPAERREWDSNPRTPFERHGLANRSLGPLGHPSEILGRPARAARPELPLQGSNLDFPDPESGVLPVTPRGITERETGLEPATLSLGS
jgi:hypothetical protein